MVDRRSTFPYVDGARRSARVYDQRGEVVVLQPGDRLFVPCEGGPSRSRLEIFPPRMEIDGHEGTYVLVDEGNRADWFYLFVPH